jgi:hypothetical protein
VERGVSARGTASLAALVTLAATAAASADPRFTVTWHPLALLTYGWQFEFEAAPSRWLSLHATPTTVITIDDGVPRPLGFALDVGVRAFPLGRAPSGLFVGAHIGGSSYDTVTPAQDGFGLRGGLAVGYTLIFARRWAFSTGAGVEYTRFTPSWQGAAADGQVLPFVRLALGVAF